MYFKITNSDGKKFARKSGDFNKIHLDELAGYNSIYGNKICHGCLVFFKTLKLDFFKRKIFDKNKFEISITFNRHFSYDRKIYFNTNKFYSLKQDSINCAEIDFKNFGEKKIQLTHQSANSLKTLEKILFNISRYVGMINPGKNSILSKIEIFFDIKNKFSSKIKIKSRKIDKRIPLINNELKFKNFKVNFVSLIRPTINKKREKINKESISKINSLQRNIMIIGASQGVGKSLLDLIKKNKKIKILSIFNRNKIKTGGNLISKKIDLNKDLLKINKMIKKYNPINVYYFASGKIFFHNYLTENQKKSLKNYFINIPIKIIKMSKNEDINFFYPSTKYIDINPKSFYSKIKLDAEKKISSLCRKFSINYKILRLDAIQSRQTINLKNDDTPSLNFYIKKKLINLDELLFIDKN